MSAGSKTIEGLREAVAIAQTDVLPDGAIVSWMGYTIKRGERGMMWVSRNGTNPMPGACCFSTVADAKKGIAALTVASAIAATQVKGNPSQGDLFWSLLELSK